MSETTIASNAPATDPVAAAAQALRDGAADAQRHALEVIPTVGDFLRQVTYTTCYAASYGAIFAALAVAQAVPKENAFVYGLIDGAHAARDAVRGVRA